tara:strand:+ start:190 stop:831 length:642 start_codon:yes stop_codon:yes gene_type:complete
VANNGASSSEASLTLGLLKAVASDKYLTQRSAASELGVALGLVNNYLKRCVKKGFVKVRQAPANRYAYYLTPKGMREKGRLTSEFLTQSLSLFRQAQQDYSQIFKLCEKNGWRRIVFHGHSDLTAVAILIARNYELELCGIVDATNGGNTANDLPIIVSEEQISGVDAHVITDLQNPQPVFDRLIKNIQAERVLTPRLLDLARPKIKRGAKKR